MMWFNGMGWGGWLVMVLAAVAFWALVVFGVVALFKGGRSEDVYGGRRGAPDAREILDQRFARGEIDVQEYHARQEVLRAVH